MRPRPDKNKVKKVLHYKDTELWQGMGYGRGPTFEVPGGAGVSDSWWKKNIKEQQLIGTKNFEYKLNKALKKYERVMGIASKKNITLAPLRDHNKS